MADNKQIAVTAQPEPADAGAEKAKGRGKGRGNIFVVDAPTFNAVCALGSADLAAVYLVLAAGTGRKNRVTSWAREAVNQRTSLNWRKARTAMDKLEKAGFLKWLSGKGTRKPRIELPLVNGMEREPLGEKDQQTYDEFERRGWPLELEKHAERVKAGRLAGMGWLKRDDAGRWLPVENRERDIDPLFLPMALVGDVAGKPTEERPVVDRIRMAQDPMTFRLLADLYSYQDLAEHGGVSRAVLRMKFERKLLLRTAKEQVWRFMGGVENCFFDPLSAHFGTKWERQDFSKEEGEERSSKFWERLGGLADAGALEWVYYVAESEEPDSPLLFPVYLERYGKRVDNAPETTVGFAANVAAKSILSHSEAEAEDESGEILVPVDRAAKRATLVGIPRLLRAKTANASVWQRETMEACERQIAHFRRIVEEWEPARLPRFESTVADFNVVR